MEEKGPFAHGETVVSGKNQIDSLAIWAHPFCRKAAGLTRAHVPLFRVGDGGPRAPWLGRVVDGETAPKPGVAARQRLAPEVTPQPGVVTDAAAVTFPRMTENSSALVDVARPDRLSACIKLLEELIELAIADLIVRNARQHHPVGGSVCAVRVGG